MEQNKISKVVGCLKIGLISELKISSLFCFRSSLLSYIIDFYQFQSQQILAYYKKCEFVCIFSYLSQLLYKSKNHKFETVYQFLNQFKSIFFAQSFIYKLLNTQKLNLEPNNSYKHKFYQFQRKSKMSLSSQYQTLQVFNQDLFSTVRRSINSLKEKQVSTRKIALQQLLKIITKQELPGNIFQEIGNMAIKDVLKCFSDHSQMCRELATNIVIELLPRASKISSFLPYIFSILIDRTNCHDLQGISNLPEKMRPPPGQKPKVLMKIVENCEEIRILDCQLLKKIINLLSLEGEQIRKHLDDIINIIRALIMDPAPQVQKMACETLELICKMNKDLLLHYTQMMGRAVLLPLISKKSKIRIAGLNALTAVFWCGLYKYNAFVFQNLIGFRDPNSVPIKDFYEPSHNINYLATFITDPNNRVRLQFMKHLKIWICDLDDKYDHHGKLVPYLLSGLFDKDQQVQQTALIGISQIGRQIQSQRQKDFRESKQFAIDAKWAWDGKLAGLSVTAPLTKRPSLGSRFFIRGHVRKFWHALYRQIRDINMENRKRACNLAIYGAIYTQNYLTQYLDNMIPHLLTSVIAHDKQQIECCQKIQHLFYYIGRFCEQSSYLHIMKSALEGKLVQNQEFIKASLKGLSLMVKGSLQAIPEGQGLCHKKQQVVDLLGMITQSGVLQEIYNYNCKQVQEFIGQLLKGLKVKGKQSQINQIFQQHFVTILKLWSVGYYEQNYVNCFKLDSYKKSTVQKTDQKSIEQVLLSAGSSNPQTQQKQNQLKSQLRDRLTSIMNQFISLFPQSFTDFLQEYLSEVYQNPPSLMDSDFKLVVVLNNYLIKAKQEQMQVLFSLTQEIISESMSYNRSVEILNFCCKYMCWLFDEKEDLQRGMNNQQKNLDSTKKTYKQLAQILERCMSSLNKFKPQKKLPVYDQHLLDQNKKQEDSDVMKINEDTFIILFKNASEAFRKFYINKIQLTNSTLGQIFQVYVSLSQKSRRNEEGILQSIKTLWAVFERENLNQEFPKRILFKNEKKQDVKSLPTVIDYIIQKIQTLGQTEHKQIPMIFSILQNCLKCFPVFANAATSLPLVYPEYNELFQKLIKYTMDEKEIELKQKFIQFLRKACKKMKPWFQLQLKMANQSQKFIKAQLIKDVLNI